MGIVQTVPRQSCRYPITVKGTGQPRFSFSDKAVSAISPALHGVQVPPVPAKQGQQRSGTERAASPGYGAVHGVWGTAPTSKNGLPAVTLEVHFEHLWEQMHCSPSSATADSQALLLIIFLLLFHQSGITKELFPGRNSQFVVDILVVKL